MEQRSSRSLFGLGIFCLTLAVSIGSAWPQMAPKAGIDRPDFQDEPASKPMRRGPRAQAPFGQHAGDSMITSTPHDDGMSGVGGWRGEPNEVRLRSRGDVPLNFAILNGKTKCAEQSIDPGTELIFIPCGQSLVWHDGKKYQQIAISRGTEYELSWSDDRWVVTPVVD